MRVQLWLIPFLWSLWTEGDPAPTDPPADPPKDEAKFTQADVKRMIDARLQEERDAAAKRAEKERQDAESARLREQQEYKTLAEKESERAAAAERERDAERQKARDRVARADVKAAAVGLGFANPDLAFRLIDTEALVFDDDGTVTNAEALLKVLATSEPYLIKADGTPARGTPAATSPTRNPNLSREERINKYLEEAGARPR
jgi:rRNA maturation endonuclease Nob1